MRYTFRPLGLWTEGDTRHRRSRYTFKASWQSTVDLLARELNHLLARDVVIQADVTDADIRLDGMLRANARVGHPGVRIAFESKHGPLIYATDSCAFWQHNVRSIALGLEALRAVDRYGVTHRGEQYTGWKQIGPGSNGVASHMTRDQAAALLERIAIGDDGDLRDRTVARILGDSQHAREVWREARKMSHPDHRGGDQSLWDQVEQAARVLRVLS